MNEPQGPQLSEHPVYATIEDALEKLKTAREKADSEAIRYIHALEQALKNFRYTIQKPSIEIFEKTDFDRYNNNINANINGNINQFINIYDNAYIINAWRGINVLIDNKLLYEAIIRRKPSKTSLDSKIKSIKIDLDVFYNKIQHLESKAEELYNKEEEIHGRLDDLSTTVTSQFSKWQEQFMSRMDDWGKQLDNEKSEIISKIQSELKDTISWSKEKKNTINKILQDIRDLHGIVAADSIAGSHGKLASEEHKVANYWTIAAGVFYLLAAVWGACGYYTYSSGDMPFALGVFQTLRFVAEIGLILWLGAFCSAQAKMHRVNERRSRWFQLEIRALGPFMQMQELDGDKKQNFRERLLERYFGHWRELGNVKETADQEHAWGKIFKEIRKIMDETRKLISK